jgi:hypothetical protein
VNVGDEIVVPRAASATSSAPVAPRPGLLTRLLALFGR